MFTTSNSFCFVLLCFDSYSVYDDALGREKYNHPQAQT